MMMIIRSLNFVLLMLVAVPCFGQEVTVRVINAADDHPLKRVSLSVRGMAPGEHNLKLIPDDNGSATFALPDPAPTHFRVDVLISPAHWDCPCFGDGSSTTAPSGRVSFRVRRRLWESSPILAIPTPCI